MTETRKRNLWRLSLRELLLIVTVVAACVGLFVVASRQKKAESELRVLREEVGQLTIEDEKKLHAIALDTDEPNSWKWRLYIPKGHKYFWHVAYEDIPRDDLPKAATSGVSNMPYWETDNEVLVTAKLRQSEDGNWRLSVDSKIGDSKNQMYGLSAIIPDEKLEWMREVPSQDGRLLGGHGQDIRDPEGPIILLQKRACKLMPDNTYQPVDEPMPGFVIWLENLPY